ncbi:hypothetical protein HNY73_008751 [Argiope bruennichi]|uniref:Uncharacterized protein n=1 Tax=Argiope bruennichi TaxID=94029 RepID=A0A8T0FDX6_ARGBR|nr:hypothetical protein HNY73_008751 [Argiope bruennichi]
MGETKKLDSFCRSIIPFHVEEEDSKPLLSVQEQKLISLLLSKAIKMDYDNLILTNSDMGTLHKTIDIINTKDFLLNPYEQADMCYDRNNTMDVENEMDSKISDEREDCSCRENKICGLCGGKCFRYLELYKSEMLQQELSVDNDRTLTLDDLPAACFELADDTEAILEVTYNLRHMFEEEFDSISENIALQTHFESFMKALLSRCIIISDEPCYLSFLLLCSLIETLAGPIFIYRKCLTYVMICSLCLRSVYERCYKDLFDEIQEFESLGSFCRSIIPFPVEGERKLLLSVHEQREISLLLSNAVDIDHKNFILTNSELETLYKTLTIICRTDNFPNPYEPMNTCCDSDSFSDDAEDVEEELDCVSSEEEEECSSGEDKICDSCHGNCYRYLVLYKGEMLQEQLSVFRSSCNG